MLVYRPRKCIIFQNFTFSQYDTFKNVRSSPLSSIKLESVLLQTYYSPALPNRCSEQIDAKVQNGFVPDSLEELLYRPHTAFRG